MFVRLSAALYEPRGRVICLNALDGEGKSALLFHWLNRLLEESPTYGGASRVSYWDMSWDSSQAGPRSISDFLNRALEHFDIDAGTLPDDFARTARLADALQSEKSLMILDNIERLSLTDTADPGGPAIRALISSAARSGFREGGLLIICTSAPIEGLDLYAYGENLSMPPLSTSEAAEIFESFDLVGERSEFEKLAERHDNFPLTITLSSLQMVRRQQRAVDALALPSLDYGKGIERITTFCEHNHPEGSAERTALYVLSLFRKPANWDEVSTVIDELERHPEVPLLPRSRWNSVYATLNEFGIVRWDGPAALRYSLRPPALATHFAREFQDEFSTAFRACHAALAELSSRGPSLGESPAS